MSKNTENYKLYTFTSDSDVADLKLLEPTFDTIDKGLVLDVGESTGSGNNYILNLGSITLTSANKGISFKFWSDKDSKGAVTINGTYKLIKAGGSSVTNLKKGAPYTITYDGGTNFFLASGGGLDTVNFTSGKLLTGYSANDSNGEKINGTMPNKGAVTQSLSVNGSLTLPSGYYDSIKVTQNIPNRGEYQMAGGIGSGDDIDGGYLAFNRIPYGYYPQSSNGWSPEIRAKKSAVANHIGLTANKIVAGNTICGVTGTATADRLLLAKSGTAIIAGSGVEISGSTFTNTDNYLIFSYCVDNDTHYISLFTKPAYSSVIITLYQISNNKNSIDRQEKDGVYFYWYKDNLIYNRGNASSWDGKTFKYRIYKITDMINF